MSLPPKRGKITDQVFTEFHRDIASAATKVLNAFGNNAITTRGNGNSGRGDAGGCGLFGSPNANNGP
ncbi:hypothetical protein HanRHA438_Chr13g0581391 [Helianthus annuus]|uniref:Uncharacterized protein n=1 Tax=Helianthus annuus TaxID=4232 RepID=A0A251SNY0_HELAN|nr:hypothetical protein HanXRQr2_Chr13g0570121 [Helianthus annuus]KAJ0479527.1 hypothetical protein HanIR_Chr13g0620991 [Helianthus annuus]KAJ0847757.1 hypothetical protein HanPSC8_Chr13g0548951 [Helianthus annuus]KAJ0856700.1 hypothetical protein HanRHA438_Chr13g0581391 [Helianthus annuus]